MTEQTITAFENFPPETTKNRNYYIDYLLEFKRKNASNFKNYDAFKLAFPNNVNDIDGEIPEVEDEVFDTNNWNDPFIARIRNFFTKVVDTYNEHLSFANVVSTGKGDGSFKSFNVEKNDGCFKISTIGSDKELYEVIRFNVKYIMGQTTIPFDFLDADTFDKDYGESNHLYMTWYNNRGRTEQFLDYDLTPVNLRTLIKFHKLLDHIGFPRFF